MSISATSQAVRPAAEAPRPTKPGRRRPGFIRRQLCEQLFGRETALRRLGGQPLRDLVLGHGLVDNLGGTANSGPRAEPSFCAVLMTGKERPVRAIGAT